MFTVWECDECGARHTAFDITEDTYFDFCEECGFDTTKIRLLTAEEKLKETENKSVVEQLTHIRFALSITEKYIMPVLTERGVEVVQKQMERQQSKEGRDFF